MLSLLESFAKVTGNDEFNLFGKFFDGDLHLLDAWLGNQFKTPTNIKDDAKSDESRKRGNAAYSTKNWNDSIHHYTMSLCHAKYNGEAYGLALGNRSAVLFSIKDYKNSLKDIELCLQSDYPEKLRPKIYVRKVECLFEIGSEINEYVRKACDSIENCSSLTNIQKDELKEKLLKFLTLPPKNTHKAQTSKIPDFDDGQNPKFAYASASVTLKYDDVKGRHVVANRKLNRGDVLFVEPAFIFAPVLNDDKAFCGCQCYGCLSYMISCVPCKTCTLCLYCSETCRDESWRVFHRWECKAMSANLWYDLGIALPAFRALLKGVQSGFVKLNRGNDVERFGDQIDNYPYFNNLMTNFGKMENVTPLLVLSGLVVSYLKSYTDFFEWLPRQPNTPKNTDLPKLIGALLTRHIAQISCNSSLISHWVIDPANALPLDRVDVACGIYPSVGMMNHSCKPNVTTFFVKDVIVVKALDDIAVNAEILNCYGVDYRYMCREDRRNFLHAICMFDCNCVICSDPSLEFNLFDGYVCVECRRSIVGNETKCVCGVKISLQTFKKLELLADRSINTAKSCDDLQNVHSCYNIRKKILNKNHTSIDECFDLYRLHYLKTGDLNESMRYLKKSVRLLQNRMGKNSLRECRKILDSISDMLDYLKGTEFETVSEYARIVVEIESLLLEAKEICSLYFNFDQVNLSKVEDDLKSMKQILGTV